jgi:hypothetical protein
VSAWQVQGPEFNPKYCQNPKQTKELKPKSILEAIKYHKMQVVISILFFLAALGFELRASHLVGSGS